MTQNKIKKNMTKTLTRTELLKRPKENQRLKRRIKITDKIKTKEKIKPKTSSFLKTKPSASLTGKKETMQAFLALIKKKGKFVPIGPKTTREAALDIGAEETFKTLGATFKVIPVPGKAKKIRTTGSFARFREGLRDFRIRQGRRIQLQD